jgi:hypothetical protein
MLNGYYLGCALCDVMQHAFVEWRLQAGATHERLEWLFAAALAQLRVIVQRTLIIVE